MTYAEQRKAIYEQIAQEGIFTWHEMYGQEYALATCHHVDAAFLAELAFAAEKLGAIFAKTTAIVQQGDDRLLETLAIPAEAFAAVRLSLLPDLPTLIGRFDFAQTPQGLKMLEFNADTPGGIVEAFYLNGQICHRFGLIDPNAGKVADLTSAFDHIRQAYAFINYAVDKIVFSSLDWHEEDAGTTRYLLAQSGLPGRFVPLCDLRVANDHLYALEHGSLQPIDLLYRLHPLGVMAGETDTDGYPTGAHVLELAAQGRLALINPPSALISQTKALQALVWNLAELGGFFSDEERKLIQTYMLPTFLENRFNGNAAFCIKPVLGREGGGITLYDATGALLEKDAEAWYWDQPMIYQELVELERLTVETLQGDFTGYVVWGAFLINGHSSAIGARLGGRITNDMSYFLPIGLK